MIMKSTILKIFTILLWLLIGSGLSFLLVSGIVKEQANRCKAVQIDFLDEKLINMIDRKEVFATLWPGMDEQYPIGKIQQHSIFSHLSTTFQKIHGSRMLIFILTINIRFISTSSRKIQLQDCLQQRATHIIWMIVTIFCH